MAMPREPDAEWPVVEAVQAGDPFAFRELVGRQHQWVRGVVVGVLGDTDRADDVAQQVWSQVWQRIDKLRDAKRWRPWLYRLARNAAIDAGRDVTRRRQRAQAFAEEPPEKTLPIRPDQNLIEQEQSREILSAIKALPALYREPFVLRHLNGWKYQQIADAMDMPIDSVETRLVRARRLLRKALQGRLL